MTILRRKNEYDLSGEFGIGYTKEGWEFYFDLEDYEKIKDFHWYMDKDGYICGWESSGYKNPVKEVKFHRVVMNVLDMKDILIDHIKRSFIWDNKKENLRIADKSKNMMNSKLNKNNTSGIKGVVWSSKNKNWVSQIMINRKGIYLGSFPIFESAVKSRLIGEKKYFGEFAPQKHLFEKYGV